MEGAIALGPLVTVKEPPTGGKADPRGAGKFRRGDVNGTGGLNSAPYVRGRAEVGSALALPHLVEVVLHEVAVLRGFPFGFLDAIAEEIALHG